MALDARTARLQPLRWIPAGLDGSESEARRSRSCRSSYSIARGASHDDLLISSVPAVLQRPTKLELTSLDVLWCFTETANQILDRAMIPLVKLDGPAIIFGGPYSNLQATEAVLASARRLGIPSDRIVCTGDLAAYCGELVATIELVRDAGIHVVMGNCDEQLANNADDCGCGFPAGGLCERLSSAWFTYANGQVSTDLRRWLAQLPRRIDLNIGARRLAVTHGGVREINRFIFASTAVTTKRDEIDAVEADGIVAGTVDFRLARSSMDGFGTMRGSSACRRTTERRGSGTASSRRTWMECGSSIARSSTIMPRLLPRCGVPDCLRIIARRSRMASGRVATCCRRPRPASKACG